MGRVTRKFVKEEAIKCGTDPIYFIVKYAKIQHPVKGLIPFHLFDYQKDIIRAYNTNRMNIILKARQLGITTVTAAYIAWMILFHRDKDVLIVATKQDVAKNTIRKIKVILKYMPKWLMFHKKPADNMHSVELSNGSRVKAQTTSDSVGRSDSISYLFVDEVAHIKKFQDIWTGLYPVISTGGRVCLASTPAGAGNFFHEEFEKAKNFESPFNCRFGTYVNKEDPSEVFDDRLMWWVHPDHDNAWFKKETAGRNPRDIAQEYLCNFNASGDTFLNPDLIERIQNNIKEPDQYFSDNRNVWIWEKPEPNAQYMISADVSRGDAADYSAFHVLKVGDPIIQVAEYKGKIKPDRLGILLVAISRIYNNAMIAPENNSGWSGQTILKIQEARHGHCLFYSKRNVPKNKFQAQADPYFAEMRNDYLPGYTVTLANRKPMLNKLDQFLRTGSLVLNSHRICTEFTTFIVTESEKPQAERGKNDDLIMALAGGLWVYDQKFPYYQHDDMSRALLDSVSLSTKKTSEYVEFSNQGGYYDRSRVAEHMANQNKIRMGNGDVIDLNWLIQDTKKKKDDDDDENPNDHPGIFIG